ncbi:MAG: polysaccharide biosynthesis/export family protein [Planctomycetota bacterium]|nr:MAG: polysaccharide biosynthesis/export family protein [Planctomycetota bacterium]
MLCLALGACASTGAQNCPLPEPHALAQPFNRPPDAAPDESVKATFETYNPAASTIFPDYRLNVGDTIEVIYHVRTGVSAESYRLKVQDVISINFPFQPSLNQTVTVLSDGTIRLLLVGEIRVVERKHRGISEYHYRKVAETGKWLRYNPASDKWESCPFNLTQTADGGWVRTDLDNGEEIRLEDDFPLDESGRVIESLIIDSIGPTGRAERYEYDQVRLRWKTRPSYVEQVGLSATELKDTLQREYDKHLRDPELTVTIKQANIKIDELKKAITTAPRGQSRLMPVKPDGTIDLPFVGEVVGYGKTIQQIKVDIEAAYSQVDLPEISVTVQMNQWAPQKVFVLGEVNTPGLYTVPTSMTLLQGIASAGGTNARAAEDIVMVVRRKGLPVPEATIVNLRALMGRTEEAKAGDMPDFSSLRHDFYLADGDIVYVPSTVLAVAGDWVDLVFTRIIRGILPYGFYTGLNFGYQLHNEPNVTKQHRGRLPNVNVQVGP